MIKHFFDNDIKDHLIFLLNSSQRRIFVCVAWLTDADLFDCLCKKSKEGLDVRIVINNDDTNKMSSLNFNTLVELGGAVMYCGSEDGLMHRKFAIIDELVITGSYNWTFRGSYKNSEEISVINNNESFEIYRKEFYLLSRQSISDENCLLPKSNYVFGDKDNLELATKKLNEIMKCSGRSGLFVIDFDNKTGHHKDIIIKGEDYKGSDFLFLIKVVLIDYLSKAMFYEQGLLDKDFCKSMIFDAVCQIPDGTGLMFEDWKDNFYVATYKVLQSNKAGVLSWEWSIFCSSGITLKILDGVVPVFISWLVARPFKDKDKQKEIISFLIDDIWDIFSNENNSSIYRLRDVYLPSNDY